MQKILVEVCVDSLEGAIVAAEAGADRLELNLALQLDGLTPSAGLVQQVLEAVSIPVIAMCRPRAGDFCYSEKDWQTMLADASRLADFGVHGIAFGANTADHGLDESRVQQMRELVPSIELVYHKAMDALRDPTTEIKRLASLGVDRIMTSGGVPNSLDGAEQISALRLAAGDEIEVLPAGGVSSANALEIVELAGVSQIHGSFSGGRPNDFAGVDKEIRKTLEQLQHKT